MRHEWIYDVLADMQAYAELNELPALADQVAVTLRVAEAEIANMPVKAKSGIDGPLGLLAGKRRRTH